MKVRYTVPSATTRVAYSGNGVTQVFSVPYNFFGNGDLDVILVNATTAVETTQVLTTNYTVTGGAGKNGSITMLVAPATGNTLVIERDIPFTQEIDLEPNDPFPAEVTEEGFDRATMLAQQNRLEIQKSPKLPPTYDPNSDPEIRIPVPEAGKVLVGNAGATGWENTAIADLSVAALPVTLTSQTNQDLLEYESAGATWKNQTLAAILKRMLTTAGDIAVNIAGTVARLGVGATGSVFTVVAGVPTWRVVPSPTYQELLSGTAATYTTPAGVKWIKVREVGGGGGGGGTGSSTAPTGATGGTTSFNSITAIGGSGGTGLTTGLGSPGGAGGTGGSGTAIRSPGNAGSTTWPNATTTTGGIGGATIFGGVGTNTNTAAAANGGSAAANTGSGGNGATGAGANTNGGAGGGAGEYCEFIISNPSATYTYTVAGGGAGGIGTGSSAATGGAGGSGRIVVEEYYA